MFKPGSPLQSQPGVSANGNAYARLRRSALDEAAATAAAATEDLQHRRAKNSFPVNRCGDAVHAQTPAAMRPRTRAARLNRCHWHREADAPRAAVEPPRRAAERRNSSFITSPTIRMVEGAAKGIDRPGDTALSSCSTRLAEQRALTAQHGRQCAMDGIYNGSANQPRTIRPQIARAESPCPAASIECAQHRRRKSEGNRSHPGRPGRERICQPPTILFDPLRGGSDRSAAPLSDAARRHRP